MKSCTDEISGAPGYVSWRFGPATEFVDRLVARNHVGDDLM